MSDIAVQLAPDMHALVLKFGMSRGSTQTAMKMAKRGL